MESPARAIKFADLADEADRKVDVSLEARRWVKEHPEAKMTVNQVAAVIEWFDHLPPPAGATSVQ